MEKLYNFEYTITAKENLKNITDYIAYTLMNEQAAYDFVVELDKTINNLQHFPFSASFSKNPNLASKGVRSTTVNKYIIHYLPDENTETIFILFIKHGSENTNKLLTNIELA